MCSMILEIRACVSGVTRIYISLGAEVSGIIMVEISGVKAVPKLIGN